MARGRTSANEHTPFPVVDDSTDGEEGGVQSAPPLKGRKRPASDEASDPPPPSKRRVSAGLFASVPAADPPRNSFRGIRFNKKNARQLPALNSPTSPLSLYAESRVMAASASASGSADLSALWKDKRRQPPLATTSSALGSVEGTEIAHLEAMAARHTAIAASIEKAIEELKKSCVSS